MKKTIGWSILAVLAVALSFRGAQVARKPLGQPDLVVTGIDFQKIQSGTDVQGNAYWMFSVAAKVKNQGRGNAGPFKVSMERNNGPGGVWQPACPGSNCVFDVSGLDGGHETTTRPVTFNNANGAPSRFRFTADSAGQVGESDENNNGREESFFSMSISKIPDGAVPGGGGIGGEGVPILKPDLNVVSWTYKDVISATVAGGKVVISFKLAAIVRNLGPGSAPASKLHFLGSAECKVSFHYVICDVPALAPNAQVEVVSGPQTFEVGTSIYCYYYPSIDYEKKIAEANETNNQHSCEKIPGVK